MAKPLTTSEHCNPENFIHYLYVGIVTQISREQKNPVELNKFLKQLSDTIATYCTMMKHPNTDLKKIRLLEKELTQFKDNYIKQLQKEGK